MPSLRRARPAALRAEVGARRAARELLGAAAARRAPGGGCRCAARAAELVGAPASSGRALALAVALVGERGGARPLAHRAGARAAGAPDGGARLVGAGGCGSGASADFVEPIEVLNMVQRLSTMRRCGCAVRAIVEAGFVMMSVMDHASKQFAVELVLPWASNIALLETKIGGVRRGPAHLAKAGDCCAAPHERDDSPRFWRTLSRCRSRGCRRSSPSSGGGSRSRCPASRGSRRRTSSRSTAGCRASWGRWRASASGGRARRCCGSSRASRSARTPPTPRRRRRAAENSPPPEVGSRWAKEMGTRKGREAKKKQGIAGLLEVAKIQKRQSEEKLRIVQKHGRGGARGEGEVAHAVARAALAHAVAGAARATAPRGEQGGVRTRRVRPGAAPVGFYL